MRKLIRHVDAVGIVDRQFGAYTRKTRDQVGCVDSRLNA